MNPPDDHPARVSSGAVPSARDDYPELAQVIHLGLVSGTEAEQALDELDLLRATVLYAIDMARHTADLLEQKAAELDPYYS